MKDVPRSSRVWKLVSCHARLPVSETGIDVQAGLRRRQNFEDGPQAGYRTAWYRKTTCQPNPAAPQVMEVSVRIRLGVTRDKEETHCIRVGDSAGHAAWNK